MKKILITGALGHIGSRFIHALRPGAYDEVVLLDDLSTQRYCSLFNLPRGVPFRFIEDDVCKADLEGYFAGLDAVIHLAAATNAAKSFEIQDRVEQVNYLGTQRVAEACANLGCKLIFISTTSVYGTQEEAVDEDCTPEELKPQSPYAESKLRAEQLILKLGREKRLRFFIGRFGTICGTSIGMRFHTAVNKFCWQACLGRPITVWRTAMHQKRPYLELGDAIRALDFVLKTDCFDNEIYNVLTANATVNQIVDLISERVPDLQVEFVDAKIMNQLSYTVLCDKFQARGYKFQGSLPQGINETIDWIRGIRWGI
jgi:UDP-glucose 4-epimerase